MKLLPLNAGHTICTMARRGRAGTSKKTTREITGSGTATGGSLAIGAQSGDEARADVSGPRPIGGPSSAATGGPSDRTPTEPINHVTEAAAAAPQVFTPQPEPIISGSSGGSTAEQDAPSANAPNSAPPLDVSRQAHPPLLFEVGWEVCWQLGGIYTVLRSKISAMQKRWGDRYTLIGPYNPVTAAREFDELPAEEPYAGAVQDLRNQGIPVHYGRWLVPGRPRVILLDYRARFNQLDSDKYTIWKDHGISSYSSDGEVNEVVAFGMVCAEFMRLMTEHVRDRPILAHFHEWMAGVAVPRIAHLNLPIATVFTTHATLLG